MSSALPFLTTGRWKEVAAGNLGHRKRDSEIETLDYGLENGNSGSVLRSRDSEIRNRFALSLRTQHWTCLFLDYSTGTLKEKTECEVKAELCRQVVICEAHECAGGTHASQHFDNIAALAGTGSNGVDGTAVL